MKSKWTFKSLGDVCQVIGGGTPSKERPDFYGGDIPWATIRDMRQDWITETEHRITQDALKNSASNVIPAGNVVIATRVGLGKVSMVAQGTAINQDLRGIVPIDRRSMDPRFLFWWAKNVSPLIVKAGTGATVQGVKVPFVKSLKIPALPISEQRRIVSILDEAFDGVAIAKANAEKNLQNARAVFEGHVQAVFSRRGAGYSLKAFSEVCEISSVLVDPRRKEYLDLLHVGGANIATKTGELIDLKTAREEGLISGKFVFDSTMVLYSKIRPYLMKVARPDFRGLCSADIYPLSVKSGQLDRDYLFHLLLSPGFTDYANAGSARAGMPKVNRDHLFAYRVSLPSVATQKRLAGELDALHQETQKLESIYQRKLAALDELKQSLLHQAFSGAL